jgi:putative DNA primase/helicase
VSNAVQRVIDALEAGGFEPRRNGAGWQARCPGHYDRNPSLSINEGDDGRALLKCHAGCTVDQVLAPLGLKFSDLFADQHHADAGARPGPERVEHPYLNSDGVPVARKVRLVRGGMTVKWPHRGKAIWWEYPHGGKWYTVRKLPEGALHEPARMLYRLPDLLAAIRDGRPVFVVEGEKCADALASLGLSATTGPAGASRGKPKWLPEHAETLRGASAVWVLADDDPQGGAHAETAAQTTYGVGVHDLRVVRFHGQRKPDGSTGGGDVADWLHERQGSGHSTEQIKAELLGLVEAAPRWEPKATPAPSGPPTPAKPEIARRAQGKALELPDVEPAAEPVNGDDLLAAVVDSVRRFVALPPGADVVVALWVAMTYLSDALDVMPRLLLTSPTRACGKSRLLAIIAALANRALSAASITASALFRVIEGTRPTLLLDEMDNGRLDENDELRAVLNSGHERANAFTIRNVGEQHEPKQFSTWAPIAFACIGKLPDTVASRCITVPMRRRAPNEAVERLRSGRLKADLEPRRRQFARWTRDHADEISAADPEVPDSLDDREADNWRALLAIADAAGGAWPGRARAAAMAAAGRRDEDAPGPMLLSDLRDLFRDRSTDRLATDTILGALRELDRRPWSEWKDGQPMKARGLARLLKPFGIEPRTVKLPGGVTAKGYLLEWFEEAFGRYLSPYPSPASPPAPVAAETLFSGASPTEAVTDSKSGPDPRQSRPVTEVTDSEPLLGGNGLGRGTDSDDADRRRREAEIRAALGGGSDACDLARALAASEAGWELDTTVTAFPGEGRHLETCDRLGVRSSDPSTWSREYRRQMRQDLESQIARRASRGAGPHVDPATPASPDGREERGGGLVGPAADAHGAPLPSALALPVPPPSPSLSLPTPLASPEPTPASERISRSQEQANADGGPSVAPPSPTSEPERDEAAEPVGSRGALSESPA